MLVEIVVGREGDGIVLGLMNCAYSAATPATESPKRKVKCTANTLLPACLSFFRKFGVGVHSMVVCVERIANTHNHSMRYIRLIICKAQVAKTATLWKLNAVRASRLT